MITTTGSTLLWTASRSMTGALSVVWVAWEQPGDGGMLGDRDVLEAALTELTGRVDGRSLEEIRPAEAEAVTVEVFARWVHDTLAPVVRAAGGENLAVRVWETPAAFGGYRARLAG